MKKLISKRLLGLILILILTLFAGFAVYAGGKQESKSSTASEGPTKIIYYLWDDPTYKMIVDTFNASQNEIYVDAKYIPAADYEAKLATLLAGGVEMDAYMQKRPTDMFTQYANGFIEPLDNLIKSTGYDISPIISYKSMFSVDGKIVAIPFRGPGMWFTYYNKKLFKDAGIPTPDTYVENGEWTWEKFSEVANKLATGDGNIYGGLMYTWGMCHVLPVFQRNKPFITKDGKIDIDDSFVFSFKLRKALEKTKAIFPLMELKATKTHYSKAFYSGKVGMLLIGAWFPPFMAKGRDEGLLQGFTWNDWGVTRLPCDEPKYSTLGWSTLNHVNSNSKHKEAAFKFIGWAGGPEGAKVVASAGLVPPNMADPEVKKALSTYIPDAKSLEYFTEKVTVNPPWYTKYGSRVQTLVGDLMEVYLSKDMSDDELMTELKKGLQEIIKTTD